MDKARLFDSLSTEDTSTLLGLLQVAYDRMTYDQRETVFGRYAEALPPAPVEGATLLEEVEYQAAMGVAVVLIVISFLVLGVINLLERWANRFQH